MPEPSVGDPYQVEVGWATNKGGVRTTNEDAFCAVTQAANMPRGLHGFYAVADGMGGEANGEVASRTAVDLLVDRLKGWGMEAWPNP